MITRDEKITEVAAWACAEWAWLQGADDPRPVDQLIDVWLADPPALDVRTGFEAADGWTRVTGFVPGDRAAFADRVREIHRTL